MQTKTKLYLIAFLCAPFALPGLLLLAVELVLLAPAALAIVCYLAASEAFPAKPQSPFVDDPTATFEKYPAAHD